MKIYIFTALVALFAMASGVFVPPRPEHRQQLLGAKECTWGPSYWCKNLTSAAGCNAVKHCIQTVWIHQQLPPDTSSVCQTCLDMVKQARDQLLSNDTQELVKEVFEGSCALLHVKAVVKECDKICDEFIPELVDTLASEMNPQVVCSVAGLCNNERIHRMLEEAGEPVQAVVKKTDTCEGCHTVVGLIEDKFEKMSRDEVLQSFLEVCGKMGSFSDGCSNIVVTYFNEIYNHLQENLNSNDVCLMSGECSAQFHQHAKVEITPISHIGYVPVDDVNDDLPCELCKQLVGHLKELLVANTTEDEFKLVLNGLCRETRQFSQECLGLVNQYYDEIYEFLTDELNSTAVCDMMGICKSSKEQKEVLIAPLLPVETAEQALRITPGTRKPLVRVGISKDTSVKVIPPVNEQLQLPIDLLVPPHTQAFYNSEVCIFCEYFLHYVQQAITSPTTEANIKSALDKLCVHLPNNLKEECDDFVTTYTDELVELLIADLKPEEVCVYLKLCTDDRPANSLPPYLTNNFGGDIETNIIPDNTIDGKIVEEPEAVITKDPQCVLCEFIMKEIEDQLQDKKTDAEIKNIVYDICNVMPRSVKTQCTSFVNEYADTVIQLLIQALDPSEICSMMKICATQFEAIKIDLLECPLCHMTVEAMDKILTNPKVDHEIVHVLEKTCRGLPQHYRSNCREVIETYGETLFHSLVRYVDKNVICHEIGMCKSTNQQVVID
ncbi:hypothetical protein NQ314_011212 [Rhamnusium bicolor]|uniref:Prosaposin n=1 Tax=Rhamnusium bicolor TaxID=1586634 RepID=A0AAV8XKQ5_9CUCU|nr:hypothetical protein NQ314_011212 [Rhamnusium bicolor]